MASMNKVILLGNLGADPELRHTQNQTAVCNFNIATTESWNDAQGAKQEKTEWHRIIVWSKLAENCAKYLAKGRAVLVEGKLQTRKWTDKDNIERYTTEIVANNVTFVGANPNKDQGQPQSQPQGQNKDQRQTQSQSHGSDSSGYSGSPSLDDIPF